MLGVQTASSAFDGPVPGPVTGTITFNTAVSGPPPNLPAIIGSPSNNQRFSNPLIEISGSCQANYLVKVDSNNIFVGAVFCSARGTFRLQIQLFRGQNNLTAHNYDALEQRGPDSATVTVYYDAPTYSEPANNGSNKISGVFSIKASNPYKGYEADEEVSWLIEIVGGKSPYAFSVDWGDDSKDVISRSDSQSFTIKHTYKSSGSGPSNSYKVIIKGTDGGGATALLQLAAIITGKEKPAVAPAGGGISAAWPLWLLAVVMVLCFWLGAIIYKRRKKKEEQEPIYAAGPIMPIPLQASGVDLNSLSSAVSPDAQSEISSIGKVFVIVPLAIVTAGTWYFLRQSELPAMGVVSNPSHEVPSETKEPEPARLDGKFFAVIYPGKYRVESVPVNAKNPKLEQYMLIDKLHAGFNHVAISVGPLGAGINEDSSYRSRTLDTAYKQSRSKIGGTDAIRFIKTQPEFEDTVFIVHRQTLATFSLTDSSAKTENAAIIDEIVKSLEWK